MSQFYDKHGVLQHGDINAHLAAERARWQTDVRQRQSAAWRGKAFRTAAAGAALLGGGAALSSILAPAAAGTTGAAGAASGASTFGVPASIGATTAGVSGLGSILNSSGMNLGVNAGLALYGQRSQNKANDQARADMLAAQRQAIDLQLRQIDEARRNSDLDRAEMKVLNDRAHALQVEQLNLQKEEATYRRDRETREDTRLAPYRRISEQAAARLASIWGI